MIKKDTAIELLFESPLNPRTHYNEKKMEELIESIRIKGIMMPLLVRPVDGKFEIAAGHRRYRAAKKLKLTEVPVIVREMNDKDFLDVLTFEKRVPRAYTEAHKKFHTRKSLDKVIVEIGKEKRHGTVSV